MSGAHEYSSQDEMRPPERDTGATNAAVQQLFARLSQEIDDTKPANCIHFLVDFLCKHYPEHLHGFASIWNSDPELERERQEVVNFFKAHKISTQISAHFTNAGYDTLEALTTLSADALVDVEAFNNVKWLPGHKVRLQQIFSDITSRIRAFKQERQAAHTQMSQLYSVGNSQQELQNMHMQQMIARQAALQSMQQQAAMNMSVPQQVLSTSSSALPTQLQPGSPGVTASLPNPTGNSTTVTYTSAMAPSTVSAQMPAGSSSVYMPSNAAVPQYKFTAAPQPQQLAPPSLRVGSIMTQGSKTLM